MSTHFVSGDVATPEAFLKDFHHTSQYGATPAGGIDRQAGTKEHGAVRDWYVARAKELGFEVRVDKIGNVFASLEFVPGAKHVYVGSHLDSQPLGGRFDGTYGVIAALYAAARVKTLVEQGEVTPEFNITVVDWFNEEGARFVPSLMGSNVFAGFWDAEKTLDSTDPKGISVREALSDIGYLGSDTPPEIASYAELHIEQGRILERDGVTIGAVDQSWYTQKLVVKVCGEQSHTGATIMADRHDALTAAAEIVLAAEAVVERFDQEQIVTSVGKFDVLPNSPIVVPRQVDLVIDLRANLQADVEEARDVLKEQIQEIAQRRNLTIDAQDFDIRDIQHYPEAGIELTEKASANLGVSVQRMRTMAGHDSIVMNRIVPSVMVFIPSEGGISHCEREFTSDEDMLSGVDVLTEIAKEMVTGVLKDVEAAG
ncbi:M20 family metallo-hydrolase [Corynebacterium sp. 153RC1]|uniref:M20 family metallo-hydrolase n=1 Tax=unclassified Corynebacterium TaxID=2624378 RepID=UPI00211CB5F6|nr:MULTISPECIES: M20 family metallo-hydrolase [unclassified Corynebacterium]MCQ9370314.1 M20 family metallo-hydrolase [Corynebacterium sp. 35RC1]MCQ9351688.1 M20 family metallo-hydrolase [Corynebacterium sp. 209RC1]MCQ9354057.1 M20 family metallo-hydrolase [Corynebacterium sp. 1222RC1]MCQ9355971.1 M20 family metallo-hydrolase [Corynebacterium sp. 122RC1]MCQ9358215.1 M20 family metallo-hydrolase [Corynebacterium sp. 142RC1]